VTALHEDSDGAVGGLSALVLGCLLVGASSTFIKLADTSADTAAFHRCALALPAFLPWVLWECRRHGRPSTRMVRLSAAAGALLGVDYLMWTQSILDAGAGVATVLIGIQVVALPVLARVFLSERIQRRFLIALPVMLVGLGLTGGLVSADPEAPHPIRGAVLGLTAGVCYAGFLLLIRPASRTNRRLVITPTAVATTSAAATIGLAGGLRQSIDLTPEPSSWLWLLAVALAGQALSFGLIGYGSVRLPADRAAAVMLLQPVAAILLGTLVLGERPAVSQYVGMAVTIGAVSAVTLVRTPRITPAGRAPSR